MTRHLMAALGALLLLLAAAPAPAQTPASRGIDLRVMTAEPNYYSETDIEVYFRSDHDAWLYVFLTEPDGLVRQIFPNRYEKDNRIRANSTGRIPSGGYRVPVEGPPGAAEIFAIAVTERLPVMQAEYGSDQIFREPYPRVYTQPRDIYNTLVALAQASDTASVRWGWAGYRFKIQPHPQGYAQPYYSAETRLAPPPAPPVSDNQDWREEFRARGRAKLRISSKPDNADIYINGKFFGETPQTVNIDAGTHDVRVERGKYLPWEREVELVAGTQRTFNITLDREPRTASQSPSVRPVR